MSQTAAVPQSFLKPPSMAKTFADNYEQSDAGQVEQRVVVAPPKGRDDLFPQTAPHTTPSTVQTPPDGGPAPNTPSAQPPVPAASADEILQRQLEEERKAFAQREQQWQQFAAEQEKRIQDAQAAQAELERLKGLAELEKKLAGEDAFADLETVDAEDARRIARRTAESIQAPLAEARAQLAAEREAMRKELQQQQLYTQQQLAAIQSARSRDELLKAHPDFFELYDRNPQFKQFLAQRDGFTSRTKEQTAMEEYNKGNVEYVIKLIDEFKGVSSPKDNIQTVAPVQVASSMPQQPQPEKPRYTLADLIYFMQTGQITQDQFRAMKKEVEAMQTAQ